VNSPKVNEVDYIQFLIAAQKAFTCCEASRCQQDLIAHDSFVGLLSRQPTNTAALWQEVQPLVHRKTGCLVIDDTTLDKPYSRHIGLVTRHWSGKHHRVVWGINLVTLLWTDGDAAFPCDCRLYGEEVKADGKPKSKNESFQEMLVTAKERGFEPSMVCFDSWYSSIENLKLVRSHRWFFLTRVKSNRQVNPDGKGNIAVERLFPDESGQLVHLKEFGFVRLFRTVAPNGDGEYWITNQMEMSAEDRLDWERQSFKIESYHRGLKQCCAVERCQCRSGVKQHGHVLLSLRAFVRLEANRLATGVSWYEAKLDIVREAIRHYLARPTIEIAATP
jgi:putative transposase